MRLILISFCVFLTLTCLVSMMAVFLGSEAPTLGLVLVVQAVLTPLILVVVAYYMWRTVARVGVGALPGLCRRYVEGWMWFVFWSINSLVIAGELSFQILRWASGEHRPWLERVPLWCAAACTLAVLAMFIWGQLRDSEAW